MNTIHEDEDEGEEFESQEDGDMSPPHQGSQESQPEIRQSENLVGQKRKKKLTSNVWEHMKRVSKNGIDYAICNNCKKSLKATSRNGTSTIRNHINRCVAKKNKSINEGLEKQKQIATQKTSDGKTELKNFRFDSDFTRDKLARMIILHEYPLSMVDHVGFREFVQSLQPSFKIFSRNTIKKDILKVYELEKTKLQNVFEKNTSRVAITTDTWTSNQKKGYMSITAHFIDDNWILQSRLLSFIYVPTPHTTEVLAEFLLDGLTTWNVETKLSTITVDNCSTNDAMISKIVEKLFTDLLLEGRLVHMRCCAHILNLVVKDGLKVIEGAIEKIRSSVLYWSGTPARWKKFEEMARQLKVSCTKKLSFDCKTRWNSTYLMLQVAFEYKDVFSRMKVRDKNYSSVPSEADWITAENIIEKLKEFYSMTEIFSGTKYPTSNMSFVQICQLRENICKWKLSDDKVISNMARDMFNKFEKYWSTVHVVLGVSGILDPRYKLRVIEFYFKKIYGESAKDEIDKVKSSCYDLLQEYQKTKTSSDNFSSASNANLDNASSIFGSEGNISSDLFKFLNSGFNIEFVKSELDHYLEEPTVPWVAEFDILNWWKIYGVKYPTLKLIARDFLAVPVSSVASESAFSTGGRGVSTHRSRLNPDTLEALMCSQSWLWNEMQGKNIASDYLKACTAEEEEDIAY